MRPKTRIDLKKGAIVRCLKQFWRPGDVLLYEDETIIRLFPPLRACWALRGAQAAVPITGRNAKRTLFGVLNPCTGHRILMHAEHCRQVDFQAYLCLLRHCYPGRRIWLLLDEAPCRTAILSRVLAVQLNIVFVRLPKQCSELNGMDQLWKELKGDLAADRQFRNIDEAVDYAEQWVLRLTNNQALQKAGVFSKSPLGGPGSFGTAGFGGSRAWANPELELAFAYVPNLCSLGISMPVKRS